MIQSPLCDTFVAPGNAGTAAIATNVPMSVTDFEAIKAFVIQEKSRNGCCTRRPFGKGVYDFF
jgi:phosphoribosylamine--glycine ligase